MNNSLLLIGQVDTTSVQPISSLLQKQLPKGNILNPITAIKPPQPTVATVIKKTPYDYFFNKHPSEYYTEACAKLDKISTPEELYKLCGKLLNDYIDYSMLLHKLNSEAKIIKLVGEMDKYWHRFHGKIKDRPIIVADTWDGYAHENWYRQALANEVGIKSEKAPIGFKNMGWGDFYDYIIDDANENLVYLPRE